MLTEQLLIKMDQDLIKKLQKGADGLGLKLSTFARVLLKNYVDKIEEDREDIATLKKYRNEKGEPFEDFIKTI